MQRLFEQIRKNIEAFIEQRDDLMMFALCTENDMPLILKTIQDIEQAMGADVFLFFTDSFVKPMPFVSAIVERLREEHRTVCEYLAKEGRDLLPTFPETLLNESQPPEIRLREAISFARTLLPKEGGHRLIWAMFPDKIADRDTYLRLTCSLAPVKGVSPWMRGVRIIVRDYAEFENKFNFNTLPHVRVTKFDVGPDAIADSMKKDVEDKSLPEEKRMQSLFSLAVQDYAYNRISDAFNKFKILLGYYQRTDNFMMQALVMNGIGDVCFHRLNDDEKALSWYECAVTPAVVTKQPIIMAMLTKNLGEVKYKLKQYADAEKYFDNLDKLDSHLLDSEGKVQAIEWKGLSQEQQGKYGLALKSWNSAAKLCRNIGLPSLLEVNLKHIERVCSQINKRDMLSEVRTELKNLKDGRG